MPTSPEPDRAQSIRAWKRHRRLVLLGRAILIAGALVAVTHWLAHLDVLGWGQPPGWLDLAAGYPTAAILLITGGILAGRRRPGQHTGS